MPLQSIPGAKKKKQRATFNLWDPTALATIEKNSSAPDLMENQEHQGGCDAPNSWKQNKRRPNLFLDLARGKKKDRKKAPKT